MSPTLALDPVSLPNYQTSAAWTEVSQPSEEDWLETAISKVWGFRYLRKNWDSYNSGPADQQAVRSALELLMVARRTLSREQAPSAVVPLSGGGVHLVWASGGRQIEIEVMPHGQVLLLRLEGSEPVGDDVEVSARDAVEYLIDWL